VNSLSVSDAALSRRTLLSALLAAGLAPPSLAATYAPGPEGKRLGALLDAIVEEDLRASPELASSYGLDTGTRAPLKRALGNRSVQARTAAKLRLVDQLRRLEAVDRDALAGMDLVNLDAIHATLAGRAALARQFDYGAATDARPYVLSHLTGAYSSIPELLDTKHDIRTEADAEAYLARLSMFGPVLLQEVDCLRSDAALGVTPPDFVQDRAIEQLKALRAQSPEASTLVAGFAHKLGAASLSPRFGTSAATLWAQTVKPALDSQIAALEKLRPAASHDAGVWRLPDGERYYAASLGIETTTNFKAVDLHKLGLELAADLGSQLASMLNAQGYGRDSLAASVMALLVDPKFVYPNDETGKAALVAAITSKLDDMRQRLPRFFPELPGAQVQIRRVPAFLEAGAPFARYEDPSIDGTRPGVFYVNLRDTSETPSWMFTTTAFHEALPGHHLQQVVLQEGPPMPLIRKLVWSSGYGEGWGLYAEQLADELGAYEDDPVGRIGFVWSALLRASRLVVDTGIHALRWSREEAIAWLVDHGGIPKGMATNEVERYCVWPGQACSYMVGKIAWLNHRERSRQALGKLFDIRDFHRATLAVGAVPLTILDRVVDDYIAEARTRRR
jgi:uncharacterized protein (DUF885 family)